MKNIKVKISAAMLVVILCAGIFCGCGNDDKKTEGSESAAVTTNGVAVTGETLTIPEISVPDEAKSEMDKFFEEQYAEMTPEEIAQFEQDLVDLGMTKEEFYSLIYLQENNGASATATE